MAQIPGAAVAAPVLDTSSLIPLVERVGNQLELRRQREQARKDQINKRWTDMLSEMDYNGLDTVQNQTIATRHGAMMENYAADLKAADGNLDEATRLEYLQKQNQVKASADRMRAANSNVQMINQEMKDKGYYKDELMMADVNSKLHVYDEALGTWVARDDVNPDEIANMLRDANYIDGDAFFKKQLEGYEKIEMMGRQAGPFGTEIITQEETRDVWLRDPDGTISRGANAEPIPNMKMLMEEEMKDPDKRKIYQQLAENAGQSLPDYMYDRVMANTGYSQRYARVITPQRESTTDRRARASKELQDNRNRIVANKVQGMYNQSKDVLEASEESTEGPQFRDVTGQFPWFLGKNQRPEEVLINLENPGSIYLREAEGEELREVPYGEYADLIQRIETNNANNKGLTGFAMEEGFFNIEGVPDPSKGPQSEPEVTEQYRTTAGRVQEFQQGLGTKYDNIANRFSEGTSWFWGLNSKVAKEIEKEINNDFKRGQIIFKDVKAAQDYDMTTRKVGNLRFEVSDKGDGSVVIYSGDTQIDSVSPEDFKRIMEGTFPEYRLFMGESALPPEMPETPEEIPAPGGTLELDTLGIPQ